MDAQDYEVFCKAASVGLSLGLQHRYEWYTNALRVLSHGLYTSIPEGVQSIDKAFLAFEKTLCSSPEEEKLYDDMTMYDLQERVNKYYTEAQVKERRHNDG
jgi:hypothetical protein